jgi:hypothetical protein
VPKTKRKPAEDNAAPLPPDADFIDTIQAARILQRSVKTLQFWRVINKGPKYYRQGRVIRYLRSDILRWGMSNAVETRG